MKKLKHTRDYRVVRAMDYPPVGDQLDALWKALEALARGEKLPAEVTKMMKAIQTIKTQVPK